MLIIVITTVAQAQSALLIVGEWLPDMPGLHEGRVVEGVVKERPLVF